MGFKKTVFKIVLFASASHESRRRETQTHQHRGKGRGRGGREGQGATDAVTFNEGANRYATRDIGILVGSADREALAIDENLAWIANHAIAENFTVLTEADAIGAVVADRALVATDVDALTSVALAD